MQAIDRYETLHFSNSDAKRLSYECDDFKAADLRFGRDRLQLHDASGGTNQALLPFSNRSSDLHLRHTSTSYYSQASQHYTGEYSR
jgi:hypothetical protein